MSVSEHVIVRYCQDLVNIRVRKSQDLVNVRVRSDQEINNIEKNEMPKNAISKNMKSLKKQMKSQKK